MTQRHRLTNQDGQSVQVFDAQLTDLQLQLLGLLGVSPHAFHAPP
jgi:hypothetical protein